MKKNAVMFFAATLLASRCPAQQHEPKAEARAAFEEAEKLPFGDPQQLALLKRAISIDPNYPQAQQSYTMVYTVAAAPKGGTAEERETAANKAKDDLRAKYAKLSLERPDLAIYPWVLGILWEYQNPQKSVVAYKKAIAVDPNFGPAYDMLGIASEEEGDIEQSRKYEAKAHEVWPNDVTIWRHYLSSYTSVIDAAGVDRAIEIAQQMAEKFPDEGVSMLGFVAGRVVEPAKRISLYEDILAKYPKQAGGSALTPLFSLYLVSSPEKAVQLADKMRQQPASANDDTRDSAKLWEPYYSYAKALVEAQALIAQGKSDEALALLGQQKTPSMADNHPLELLRAKALASSGKVLEGYNQLVRVYAAKPSYETYPTLLEYGKKLGKSQANVDADVEITREKISKDGISFTLVDYATGKPVSLDDYRGRVVLVNFWYPKCGPCRGEFPYLQMALDKYKDRGFAILAINGHSPEDDWVMPLIRGWHLTFTPLKSTDAVLKSYGVRSYPNNFLYGADGRIYPIPRQIRPDTLDELELQIEGLMAQATSKTTVEPNGAELQ